MTIWDTNYGNRLQNYALQNILEGYGHRVETLRRQAGFDGPLRFKLRGIKAAVSSVTKRRAGLPRRRAFASFDEACISFSPMVASEEYVSAGLADAFDCFVIGSDQIWNPTFNGDLVYLPMVPKGKKVSYAASYGVSAFKGDGSRTAELLRGMSYVSVREDAGAAIVFELTGEEVAVVLDPTLLLGPKDWEGISKKPVTFECGRPFAFKYVLGNDVNARRIEALASSRGLEIIDVMDPSLAIGPSEFVWLVAHSELVCTDSFHASVFALLHHKPLAIFERVSDGADMSSRFDTLCEAFGLVGHRSSEDRFGEDSIYGTDWDEFERRLEGLRFSSRSWLESALEGVARG